MRWNNRRMGKEIGIMENWKDGVENRKDGMLE
jgi:hypothetical protein